MANEQFNRMGHPSRWINSTKVSSSAVYFTGSEYGAAALIRGTAATGYVSMSGGGVIDVADLDAGVIHELSIEEVGETGGGTIYVLKQGGGAN